MMIIVRKLKIFLRGALPGRKKQEEYFNDYFVGA